MRPALSKLAALLTALRTSSSWILTHPKLVRRALIAVVRRLALWATFLRSKLHRQRKEIGKHPRETDTASRDTINPKAPQQNLQDDSIRRAGNVLSLDNEALSPRPTHTNIITRHSNSPAILGQPQSRSVARIPPHLHTSHYPPPLNSPVASDAEPATPVEPSTPQYSSEAEVRPHHHNSNTAARSRNSFHSPSSDSIELETTTPLEPTSPTNYVGAEPQVASSSGHPSTSYQLTDSNDNTSPMSTPGHFFGPTPPRDPESEVHVIKPVLPEATKRYARRTKIPNSYSGLTIEPMRTVFNTPSAPAGWLKLTHPEGARYFYHPEKRVYTESDLYNPRVYVHLMDDIGRLEHLISTLEKPLPSNAHLMIDVSCNAGERGRFETCYYYADHAERAIFFLHPFDTYEMDATWETMGTKSFHHLGYEIQAQYWYFVSLYPDSCTLTTEMVRELRDIVLHLIGDTMSSRFNSTAPYMTETLVQILTLIDGMEKNVGPQFIGCMSLFARHMFIFSHSQFVNYYGESFARIERASSVFGSVDKRSWAARAISFMLFSAPDVHLRDLQKVWVDNLIRRDLFEENMKKLIQEWNTYILLSTVMLTVNVSFLAIQSVDSTTRHRSLTQIFSYISSSLSFSGLSVGALLQNRAGMVDYTDNIHIFLAGRSPSLNHHLSGVETLAILYSLPYGLLLWGMLSFLVAFSFLCFKNSDIGTRNTVGAVYAISLGLFIWCIGVFRHRDGYADENNDDRPTAREVGEIQRIV